MIFIRRCMACERKHELLRLQMISTDALRVGVLRFTPVAVLNIWIRAALLGLEVAILIGLPTLLFVWADAGDGEVPGISWCVFKGVWTAFVALPIIAVTYLAAIDERHFSDSAMLAALPATSESAAGASAEDDLTEKLTAAPDV